MLRISRQPLPEGILLRLEGKLLGPWVEEFRSAIHRERTQPDAAIFLDLDAVSYVDCAGTRLLRELLAQGTHIARRSPYVAALLDPEAP